MENKKQTMTVPEMRKLLGLKKTESYWLVHRNFFRTDIVAGQMQIDVASFEEWYANQVREVHKILRSCFRQAVKWGIMEKNPALDATVPKHKKQEREIWTAEMLMQAIEA